VQVPLNLLKFQAHITEEPECIFGLEEFAIEKIVLNKVH
jgi:hypothetical protein